MGKKVQISMSVIDRLFHVLKERYGSNWCMQFIDGADRQDSKLDWYRSLKWHTAHDIKRALDKLDERYPRQPPDLAQFDALCGPQKPPKPVRPGYETLATENIKVADRATGAAEMQKMRELGVLRR